MTERTSQNASLMLTVGHSTRTMEEFLRLLSTAGVTLLADVRRFPTRRVTLGSARPPLWEHYGGRASSIRICPGSADAGARSPTPRTPAGETPPSGLRRPHGDAGVSGWPREAARAVRK